MIDFDNDCRFKLVIFSRGVEIPKWALLQIIEALPEDVLLFHADYDFKMNRCALAFWSREFEHVPLGRETPSVRAWIDTENRKAGLEA